MENIYRPINRLIIKYVTKEKTLIKRCLFLDKLLKAYVIEQKEKGVNVFWGNSINFHLLSDIIGTGR